MRIKKDNCECYNPVNPTLWARGKVSSEKSLQSKISSIKKTYNVIANALVAYSNNYGTPYEYDGIFNGASNYNYILTNFSKYFHTIWF